MLGLKVQGLDTLPPWQHVGTQEIIRRTERLFCKILNVRLGDQSLGLVLSASGLLV